MNNNYPMTTINQCIDNFVNKTSDRTRYGNEKDEQIKIFMRTKWMTSTKMTKN